jgi:hypothetical protein
MIETVLEGFRKHKVDFDELPGLSWILQKESDTNVTVFLARLDMVKVKMVILSNSVVILDEFGRSTIAIIKDMQRVALLATGLRSLIFRNETEEFQTFSFESYQERERFIAEFREKFILLWPAEFKVNPLQLNMRMRFHAITGRRETDGPAIYFFGGTNDDFETLGQLFKLTFLRDHPQWQLCPGTQPEPRRRASLAVNDFGIFLFGGKSDGRIPRDDFLCYKREWKSIHIISNTRPPAGWGYDLISCPDNQLLLTGGFTKFLFYRCKLSDDGLTAAWTVIEPAVSFVGLM